MCKTAVAMFYEYDPFVGSNLVIAYRAGGDDMHGTGIVRIYIDKGFTFAADGLRRDLAGKEVSEREQKVFNAECGESSFAFAATGVTYVNQGDKPFDVIPELKAIAETMASKQYDSAVRYIEAFAKALRKVFCDAQTDGRIKEIMDYGKGDLVIRVLFAGYYRRLPFMAQIELHREGQEIKAAERSVKELSPRDISIEISGSDPVKLSLLSADDRTFPAHDLESWKLVRQQRPFSISNAVELARTYLDSCKSAEGRKLDKDCESIGGHIHVATVTPENGFQWTIPPLPPEGDSSQ